MSDTASNGPIRLVVTDVDGTLVKHDKTLDPGDGRRRGPAAHGGNQVLPGQLAARRTASTCC